MIVNVGDWSFRFKYQATVWEYNYGRPETRPAKITNPDGYGALCKHLTAMLSNKQWLQQVASILLDWCVKNLDQINEFLKLQDDKVLTLPNELARQNAKAAFYSKLFKDKVDDEDQEENENEDEDNENNIDNDNLEELEDVNGEDGEEGVNNTEEENEKKE